MGQPMNHERDGLPWKKFDAKELMCRKANE